MKVLLLALLPLIVGWVVLVAVRDTVLSQTKGRKLEDSGRFDPTEALYGIL